MSKAFDHGFEVTPLHQEFNGSEPPESVLQALRCVQGDDAPLVDDGDTIAQVLRLLQDVGGEEHGQPLLHVTTDHVQGRTADKGIQPHRRFVQKEKVHVVHELPRYLEAALQAD